MAAIGNEPWTPPTTPAPHDRTPWTSHLRINLDQIRAEHLNVCPPCDYGLPGSCECPTRDPRATIGDLVDEVAMLRKAHDDLATEALTRITELTGRLAHHQRPPIDRADLIRRMLSALDGTHYTENEEVAEAIADTALRALTYPGPRRDDPVATWLKQHRDNQPTYARGDNPDPAMVIDDMLDEYRLRGDIGASLATPADQLGPTAPGEQ